MFRPPLLQDKEKHSSSRPIRQLGLFAVLVQEAFVSWFSTEPVEFVVQQNGIRLFAAVRSF